MTGNRFVVIVGLSRRSSLSPASELFSIIDKIQNGRDGSTKRI